MDIIDIMLARALTPQGQTDAYVAKANRAAAKAAQAEEDAAAAIATVTEAASGIEAAQEMASGLLATAQEVLETAQAAQLEMIDLDDVDDEIENLTFDFSNTSITGAKVVQFSATYPNNVTPVTDTVLKMYTAQGENEDGTMTQKAIKTYVESAVGSTTPSGGGTIQFDTDMEGHILVVDENGHVTPSNITEEELVQAFINSNTAFADDTVGLEINYTEKSFNRLYEASGKTAGTNFDEYTMYGGRMRCNVANDGTITAFYGDNNYKDDGSNGQVMVYQPKFYYRRILLNLKTASTEGKVITHEQLLISPIKQAGFKLAPIFKNGNEELEYVLFSAYEASEDNQNKLASIANAKPISNLTAAQAEEKASARGTGWHIMSLAAESANQMLEMVEGGSLNGQEALGRGISDISTINNVNCASLTGSTASLGNITGRASETTSEINGTTKTETASGKTAISYRGMENPWGNMWEMIGDVIIDGQGDNSGGIPYICTDFNYTPNSLGNNYESIGFALPAAYGWVSNMGYGSEKYDWVYLPIETSNLANSSRPVGDYCWINPNNMSYTVLAVGGSCGLGDENGPFYYAADRNNTASSRPHYGARIMFIPSKNGVYTSNIVKWTAKMGA